MRSASVFAAIVICAVLACSKDASIPRTSPAPELGLPGRMSYTRDSAGVEILDFPLSVKDLAVVLSIDSIPLVELGGRRQDPQHNLHQPEGDQYALQLSGPRYLVKDHNELRLFDSQIRHVVTIGGSGEGRGTLQQLTGFCVTDADTILALEPNRISVFTIGGKFVRSTPPLRGVVEPSGCFRDGTLLLRTGQIGRAHV